MASREGYCTTCCNENLPNGNCPYCDIIYDDEHDGPRWTYGMQYRPLSMANVPAGWIIGSNDDHPEFQFGSLDYPFKLSDETAASFELTLIDEN